MKRDGVNNFMNLSLDFKNKLNLIKKSKKSQVTLFIIIVIIVVATAGVVFYFTNNNTNNSFSSDPAVQEKFDNLKNSILSCSDLATIESLNTIGIQGGYYDAPEKSFNLEWAFIPYYYSEGVAIVPTSTKVEGELGKFVNDNIKLCINDIDKSEFNVNYNEPKTDVQITQSGVGFVINMPISLSRNNRAVSIDLKDMPKSYDIPLMDILNLGKYIANEAVKDDKNVCLTCIAKEAEDRNLLVDFINLEEAGTLVVISENYTASGPYSLEFLNKYKE